MIMENDNSELAGYFEAFLEDFQKIATDMLSAINVDRGATLKIPDTEYNRLKRVGEALDALAKRKFNFENTPDFKPVVDALGQVQQSIERFKFPERIPLDMPAMERNIASPEIDLKPVTQSIEKLEQLFLSGLGVRITNFDEMPLVFDKVTGATGGGVASEIIVTQSALPTGAATNAKLDDVITAIEAIQGGGGVQYTEGDTDASITGTAMLFEGAADTLKVPSQSNPLPVNFTNASLDVNLNAGTNVIGKVRLVDSGGTEITETTDHSMNVTIVADDVGIGGGTQYTEGDTDASITGIAMMWEDTSDTLRAVSAAKPLPISVASLPLPSGAATSAKQDTEITHLATLAGAVAGTEVQVDVLTMPTVAVTGTFWQATQPVSAASLPLPSGAATSAKQPALGTAGSASTDVISIQGIASMTPVQIGDNSGSLTVDAPVGTPVFVRLSDGSSAIATLPVSLASVPSHAVSTVTTVSTLTNITNWGNIVDNAGFTDGTTRLMPSGYIFDEVAGTALTENDAAAARIDSKRAQVFVIEDETTRGQRMTVTSRKSLLTEGPTAADAAIAANPITVGGRASDSVPSAMSADGDVVNSWLGRRGETIVSLEPKAFGGCSIYRSLDLDETEEDVKTSAGTLYGYFIFNAAATTRYVKIYNATAANVTVGSTTPVLTIPIPAGAAANVEFSTGIAFSTAICIAATTGVADADTGAPAANDVIMNVFYK